MENLLIMGVNTRPMVNSALKLNYKTFSVSYFKTYDFNNPFKEKHILDQESIDSCGFFENNYSPQKLLELSREFLYPKSSKDEISDNFGEMDKIVLITGIHASDFKGEFSGFKNRIRGNLKTEDVDDKFKFYRKLRNKVDVPLTFKLNDVDELKDILKQYPNNQFILKPLKGNGGLGIFIINYDSLNELNDMKNIIENISTEDYILQEYIEGTCVSSSVLASHDERINLFNSRLISERDLGNESFAYSGNIVPLDKESFLKFNSNYIDGKRDKSMDIDSLNKKMNEESEKLIKEFKLIGSNGVDFILDENNDLKVIEINPRLQGTYELCEECMDINLLDAHIRACEGELIDVPNIDRYAVKKIIYAKKQIRIGNLSIKNVFDVPYEGVKIESNQPLVTLISSNENLDKSVGEIAVAEEEVYKNIE
ncbi:MAG: ATP-grasp domain-containing protein [Methanobrevibacter sp.]|nr:ATP-grasp domain-containing protein [Methanobrevibacter sp.]